MTAIADAPSKVVEDLAARERIRDDLAVTLFVQAAAGSGKTAALVARVTALVDRGVAELREVAAITFTEAAAAELRERVGRAIAEPTDDPLVAQRRRVAAVQLDEAAMTTIHGFAQRLLAEHPLEAGLPVRFDVADEPVAAVRREERFESFADRLLDNPAAADLVRAAAVLGVGVDALVQIATQMTERCDDVELPPEQPDLPAVVRGAAVGVRSAAASAARWVGACSDPDDRLLKRLNRLGSALGRGPLDADWLTELEWLVALPSEQRAGGGRTRAWAEPGIDEVRAGILAYESVRAEALACLYDAVLAGIGRRMLEDAAAYAAERRATGGLFFHDLLVISRDLLGRRPDVRTEVRERYRYVLVDEFQDTDPLQYELLSLLATAPGANAPDPGRMFYVGDPMQSIYRFRGADVDLYRGVRAAVGRDGLVNLTTNFRSTPQICSFVSGTFTNFVEGDDAASVHLRPYRDDPEGRARVWAIGGGDCELRAPERRVAEADGIVAATSALVAQSVPVADVDGVRPARFGDVAVLVPNRAGVPTMLRAFATAGIDVTMSESTLVYAAPEVADVLAVVRAVEDRGDDRDVVAALRSGLLALTDAALRAHSEAGGTWDLGTGSERPGTSEVLAALAVLRELRDRRIELGPIGTLEAILERLSAREIAAATGGVEALRRLDFLLDRARVCRDGGGRTLGELLRFFLLEQRAGVRAGVPASEDADAVRISTVHGAKGLEFPIVVLAELGATVGARPRTPALLESAGRLEISLGGGRATAGYAALAERAAEADRAEAIRLAYVAATRAHDYLVVSLHHRLAADEPRSLAGLLAAVVDLPEAPAAPAVRAVEPPRVAPLTDAATLAHHAAIWRADSARAARPRTVTPSALEATAPGARRRRPSAVDADPVDWRRARASSGIGRAVHAVLQRADLVDSTGIRPLAERFALLEGCAEYTDDVASLASAATRAPIVRSAARAGELHRELPITLATGDGYVEGVVDLCFSTGTGYVIVDYKTDVVADEDEAAARALRYRHQAGAYAWAVGEITGRPVERVVFLFLAPPDGSIAVEVEDLAAAIAETKDLVAATVTDAGRGRP